MRTADCAATRQPFGDSCPCLLLASERPARSSIVAREIKSGAVDHSLGCLYRGLGGIGSLRAFPYGDGLARRKRLHFSSPKGRARAVSAVGSAGSATLFSVAAAM